MRDLFSYVCTYMSVTLRNVNLRTSVTELIRHVHLHGRIPDAMPSLATSNGGQGRTALLDNGGRIGQRVWSSSTYAFC